MSIHEHGTAIPSSTEGPVLTERKSEDRAPEDESDHAVSSEGNDVGKQEILVASTENGTVVVTADESQEGVLKSEDGPATKGATAAPDASDAADETGPSTNGTVGEASEQDEGASAPSVQQESATIETASLSTGDSSEPAASLSDPTSGTAEQQAQPPATSTEGSAPEAQNTAPSSTEEDIPVNASSSVEDNGAPLEATDDASSGQVQPTPSSESTPVPSSSQMQTTSTPAATRPVVPKTFKSSLSMNKKFLEKAGAGSTSAASSHSDSKSPAQAAASLPKAGLGSTAGRSPSLAHSSIPNSTSTSPNPTTPSAGVAGATATSHTLANAPAASASATSTTAPAAPVPSSSAPRLLTGRLPSGNVSSATGLAVPSAPAGWGRTASPSAGSGQSGSTAPIGRSGFVPAPVVGGQSGSIPSLGGAFGRPGFGGPSARPGFGRGGPDMGRGPPSMGPLAPWQQAARAAAGMGGGSGPHRAPPSMAASEFPSFQETARAEKNRQSALIAKEHAAKMQAAAAAAYNQRVLENLKGFSGVHSDPAAPHWDEMDDDDDMGEVLEFADGMRYEVHTATNPVVPPTAAEQAAFDQAAEAESHAAALHAKYEEQVAAEEEEKSKGTPDGEIGKSERFVDDFDRRNNGESAAARQSVYGKAPTSPVWDTPAPRGLGRGEPAPGRTLYNDRLGKFEPYAGKSGPPQAQPPRKDQKQPPALLQRTSNQSQPHQQPSQPSARKPSVTSPVANTSELPSTSKARRPSQSQGPGQVPARTALPPQNAAFAANRPSAAPQASSGNAWAKPLLPPPQSDSATAPSRAPPQVQPASAPQNGIAAVQGTPASVSQPAPPVETEDQIKAEMHSHAERARLRRQKEEEERQAQVERARKKAAEIEEKMKAAAAAAAPPVVALANGPAKMEPKAILSPSLVSAGSQSTLAQPKQEERSWRRSPQDVAAARLPSNPAAQPLSPQSPRTILNSARNQPAAPSRPFQDRLEKPAVRQPATAQVPATVAQPLDKPIPAATLVQASSKATPSSAAFAALADFTSASLKKPVTPPATHPLPPATTTEEAGEPVVEKHDIAVGVNGGSVDQGSRRLQQDGQQVDAVPRVRLGKATPTSGVEAFEMEQAAQDQAIPLPSELLSHAFPQPTIIVARTQSTSSPHAPLAEPPQQLSALDKIMDQVKAARETLKTQQSHQTQHFDGALSRISQAINGESGRTLSTDKEEQLKVIAASLPIPHVQYEPEVFEASHTQRPPSPRIWKTFTIKVPSASRRPPLGDVSPERLRAFEDRRRPVEVYSSTWKLPKGQRGGTRDDFLFVKPAKGEPPVVKMHRFPHAAPEAALTPPPSEPQLSEGVKEVDSSLVSSPLALALRAPPSGVSRSGRALTGSWRKGEPTNIVDPVPTSPILVMVSQESITVEDTPSPKPLSLDGRTDAEEEFATRSYEDHLHAPETATIRVSLPKASVFASQQSAAPSLQQRRSISPETGRFKTYGPKLPDNSTVVFSRKLSASIGKDADAQPKQSDPLGQTAEQTMFMVTSEIERARQEQERQRMQSRSQAAETAPSTSSPAHGKKNDNDTSSSRFFAAAQQGYEPDFPTLSFLSTPNDSRAQKSSTSPRLSAFDSSSALGQKELPRHVIAELERLNATVAAAPLTAPSLRDTQPSLLARTASPWSNASTAKPGGSVVASYLAGIDPTMSVWSKPTEETAAAAAAGTKADNAGKQENSLRDIIDDYPMTTMPSSTMELQISEGERDHAVAGDQRASGDDSGKPIRGEPSANGPYHYPSHIGMHMQYPQYAPFTGHSRQATSGSDAARPSSAFGHSASSRQSSIAYASFMNEGVPSPYAGPAALPTYSPKRVTHHLPSQSSQSSFPGFVAAPQSVHSQYPGYVAAPGTSHMSNGLPSGYSHVPVAMSAGQDVRHLPTAMTGQAPTVWVQATAPGVPMTTNGVIGQYHPYSGYGTSQPQPKARTGQQYHAGYQHSPYSQQQRGSPVSAYAYTYSSPNVASSSPTGMISPIGSVASPQYQQAQPQYVSNSHAQQQYMAPSPHMNNASIPNSHMRRPGSGPPGTSSQFVRRTQNSGW